MVGNHRNVRAMSPGQIRQLEPSSKLYDIALVVLFDLHDRSSLLASSSALEAGELTSDQVQHIALIALVGGLIGLGFGFAIQFGNIKRT